MSRRFVFIICLLLVGGLPAAWVLGAGGAKPEAPKLEAIAEAVKIARTNQPGLAL